jgi:hypothetical protein
MSFDFLAPVKEDASIISVSTLQPSNELIDSQDKIRENCSLSFLDYFEQWNSSSNNIQVLEIIKFLQVFKDGWNKGIFCQG